MLKSKCIVCGKTYDIHELFCMLAQRGGNSLCKGHIDKGEHICTKCGGLDKLNLKCPYCGNNDITLPQKMLIKGKYQIVRRCNVCNRIFNPDGSMSNSK